ncbi:hypothetical protein [Gordonia hydrophobica]|uniref:Uncharacterized protein n=1 Tax=Gordonia hydrophobica TaxID=40516 RepID=A0ABZ2U601_9ACTN|nr:hypothetical protein [Gordonia hydrophobica]MBM7368677.1 hypothetical protein [Gordonia hydrophobica]
MPNKLLVVLASALVVLVAGLAVVLRRSRTAHPPVSPTVPRIEDVRGLTNDSASAGNL